MYIIKNIIFKSQTKIVGFDFDFDERVNGLDDKRKLLYLRDIVNSANDVGDIGDDDNEIEMNANFELNHFLKEHNFDTMPEKFDKSLTSIRLNIVHDVSDEDELGEYGLLFDGYNFPDVKRDDGTKNPKNIDIIHRDVSKLLSQELEQCGITTTWLNKYERLL